VRRIDKALPDFRVSSSGFLSVNAGLYGSAQVRLGSGTRSSNPASSSGESGQTPLNTEDLNRLILCRTGRAKQRVSLSPGPALTKARRRGAWRPKLECVSTQTMARVSSCGVEEALGAKIFRTGDFPGSASKQLGRPALHRVNIARVAVHFMHILPPPRYAVCSACGKWIRTIGPAVKETPWWGIWSATSSLVGALW
jgi:hypothetical protein